MKFLCCSILFLLFASCSLLPEKKHEVDTVTNIKIIDTPVINYADTSNPLYINTGNTKPVEIVEYAQNFIGTPYVYASSNPSVGFDCSGFITYVFNHFNITVPRSSAGFTNVPLEIPVNDAKPADLILFTGTDSTIRIVGHMGIIVYNANDELLFIHATSGKKMGVTITPLNNYYQGRFVKVIRIFPQNGG